MKVCSVSAAKSHSGDSNSIVLRRQAMEKELTTMALIARVERLEKQNKWTRAILFCTLILTAFSYSARTIKPAGAEGDAAAVSKVIRTNRLEIVDDSGKISGVFESNGGAPFISLYNEEKERGRLSLASDGAPNFYLFDKEGKSRFAFGLTNGDANLDMYDKDGKERAGYFLSDGNPGLVLKDNNGKERGGFFVKDGDPTFYLADKTANKVGVFALTDGEPLLGLYDKDAKIRCGMIIVDKKPSIKMFDANEKEQWSAH